MEMNEKKNSITEVMQASMAKIREMVDSNTICLLYTSPSPRDS